MLISPAANIDPAAPTSTTSTTSTTSAIVNSAAFLIRKEVCGHTIRDNLSPLVDGQLRIARAANLRAYGADGAGRFLAREPLHRSVARTRAGGQFSGGQPFPNLTAKTDVLCLNGRSRNGGNAKPKAQENVGGPAESTGHSRARYSARLDRDLFRSRLLRLRHDRAAADAGRMRGAGAELRRGRTVPQPHHHGASWLRPRRIQIFRLSVAGHRCRLTRRALSTAGRSRQPLEQSDGRRCRLSRRSCRLSAALP